MTRDIIVRDTDFTQTYGPLIADDLQAYRIVYKPSFNFTSATLKVTALRADGQTVVDTASIVGNTIYYTLKNNMHAIIGEVRLRLTLFDNIGTAVTHKEILCNVIEGNGEPDLMGDDRVPLLSSMITQATAAANYANEQGEYAKDKADTFLDNENLYRGILPNHADDYYSFNEFRNLPEGFYRVENDKIGSLNLPNDRDYGIGGRGGFLQILYVESLQKLYLKFTEDRGFSATLFLGYDEELNPISWRDTRSFTADEAKDYALGGAIYNHVNNLESEKHITQDEVDKISTALQHDFPEAPANDTTYTLGELFDLSDNKIYYALGLLVDYLNLPPLCDFGYIKKTSVGQLSFLQYTDISGKVYYLDLIDKENSTDLVTTNDWYNLLSSSIDSNSETNIATSKAVKDVADLLKWGEWITPAFVNNWSGTMQYRKNGLGEVQFRGSVSGGTGDSVICTIAKGYRPENTYFYISNANANNVFARGYIHTNGTLFVNGTAASTIHFSGIRYDVAI